MKHQLLISLGKESFSNVTFDFEGTSDEAIQEGKRLLKVVQGGGSGLGLNEKEWVGVLNKLWTGKGILESELSKFNEYQVKFYRDFKNTRARAKGLIKSEEVGNFATSGTTDKELEDEMMFNSGPGKGENGDYSGMD